MGKADMTCARVKQYQSSDIGSAERHNERKNESYENLNVDLNRTSYNIHFKDVGDKSYMDTLREMEKDGKVSLRGLRQDATLFDEIIIDVNTMYFERNGGYEYAKRFYEEAYRFIEKKFGSEYVVSAVMHADEINKAATDDMNKPVFHYHLHAVVLPIVEKEILWSKRCKDPKLVGTVKEVVHQISHSKKWASEVPLLDDSGNVVMRKNGKPKYRPSYSVLQDELFEHMQEHGFRGFRRGERGSTAEHLSSLDYQIEKDTERLNRLQERVQQEQVQYDRNHSISVTYHEIEAMGQKSITGKMVVSKEDYGKLTELAKEGISSRSEIHKLKENVEQYRSLCFRSERDYDTIKERYDALRQRCAPFLTALEHFPDMVKLFSDRVKELFTVKQAEQQKAKQEREAAARERYRPRRSRKEQDWER